MIYRIDYDSDQYKALYISALQLVKIMKGKTGANAGGSLADNWLNVKGSLDQKKAGASSDEIADISFWHHSPVFSESAYEQLKNTLGDFGEFLPVDVDGSNFYVFNVLRKGDEFIDSSNSKKDIVDGVQMGIGSIVFEEGSYPLIFKTDFDKNVRVFCAEAFKTLITDAGLSGLTFDTDLK